MPEDIPLLANVRIAAPCPANWSEMVGGDRVRYCRSCEKNVYNLSEMNRSEAEKLLQTHEGSLCVRYYRRTDGMIMTNNCPVGLRTIRKMYLKTAASAAALCSVVFGAIVSFGNLMEPKHESGGMPLRLPKPDVEVPPPHRAPEREPLMGAIAISPESEAQMVKDRIAAWQDMLNDSEHPVSDIQRKDAQALIKYSKTRLVTLQKELQRDKSQQSNP